MIGKKRYFILETWSRIILLLDDMIKNSLASVVCESSCDVASFLLLEFRLYELGCDATSFFLRSDDRLKLGRKDLAFRVWRIESRNMCFAREKRSEYIDEIWQGIGASDACDDACDLDKIKNKKSQFKDYLSVVGAAVLRRTTLRPYFVRKKSLS